jgi:hypothetical protein
LPKFFPPTVEYGPAALDYLFYRYKLTRGISVLKIGNLYKLFDTPSTDQIDASSEYYAGGHEYEVSDATKTALLNANIGITEDNFGL